MDEGQLKKILGDMDVPPVDENAKKRAINLSMAEFQASQKEKQETSQGFSILGRLMGNSNKTHRRKPMNKRLVFSGMATAMVVVLAAGASMNYMSQSTRSGGGSASGTASINTVNFAVNGGGGGNNFGSIASNITSSIATSPNWFGRKTAKKSQQTELAAVQFNTGPSSRQLKPADNRARESQRYASRPESRADRGWIDDLEKSRSKAKNEEARIVGRLQKQPLKEAEMDADSFRTGKLSVDKKNLPASAPTSTNNFSSIAQNRTLSIIPSFKLFSRKAEMPVSAPLERQLMAQGSVTGWAGASVNDSIGIIAPIPGPVPIIVGDEIIDPNYYKDVGRDQFEDFEINPIKLVSAEPVSTFSIDVDTASYSFMRRQINAGVLPQKDAVRIEEMINYFDYDYPQPATKEKPFEASVVVVPSPWKDGKKLIHIGIKGYDIDKNAEQPRSNLVFLLDVSGSMNSPDKLPLMVNSLKLLLDSLQPDDTVGIVVYAGAAGTVLEPTKISDKGKILAALDALHAGGSTAGAEGIRQAYQLAESNFDKDAVNRVILATDGDFNVGITNRDELKDFIERKRETGIFLSVFGFGQGNLNDHLMQELAQNGNGIAAYIDTLSEARKVLVEEATSTLFPIAKDVKIQVEFNPATVAEYRLVGYETRHLNQEDFNNDAVDAGDIGAGHTVTAIYEITPVGGPLMIDASRYQKVETAKTDANFGGEYAFLKIRYKLPDQNTSILITTAITVGADLSNPTAEPPTWDAVQETGWATAVAGFGQLLKGGKYTGDLTYDDVIELANKNKGKDEFGHRAEFVQLVRLAKSAASLQKN